MFSSRFVRTNDRLTCFMFYASDARPATCNRARCNINYLRRWSLHDDDMRQVSNLLFYSAVSLPLVKHLHRALLWLFNRRSFFVVKWVPLHSSFTFAIASPESSILLHMNYVMLSPRVLNILIFTAPLHRRQSPPLASLTRQPSRIENWLSRGARRSG